MNLCVCGGGMVVVFDFVCVHSCTKLNCYVCIVLTYLLLVPTTDSDAH